jgi:hypothetical protein
MKKLKLKILVVAEAPPCVWEAGGAYNTAFANGKSVLWPQCQFTNNKSRVLKRRK